MAEEIQPETAKMMRPMVKEYGDARAPATYAEVAALCRNELSGKARKTDKRLAPFVLLNDLQMESMHGIDPATLAKVLKGRSREAIFLLVILPFWSNGLVRIFSWAMVLREGGILDTALNAVLPFKINIDLMYSYPAVIIGLVHSYVPYMVLTCYLTLQAIDDSLIEAGRSLGASRLQVLKRVIIPLSMPGLVAGAALIFVPVVGSFMEPRILGGRTGTFYGTVIEDQFVAVFNWPLGAALSFILLAVVLVILAVASPVLKRAA